MIIGTFVLLPDDFQKSIHVKKIECQYKNASKNIIGRVHEDV
jgi:hypothetical protein